jgi:arylsulfatase A-like enzyme
MFVPKQIAISHSAASIVMALLVCIARSSPAQTSATFPRSTAQPNILFILADDLGYGDVGCYGQTKIKTPNIDKLAAEGMRFTDFYAGSTVCAPSRACLMTGLHTGHALIRGNKDLSLQPNDLTVAEILRRNGFATSLIGKWGLGDPGTPGVPQKQGFDEFIGYLNQTHAHDYYTDHLMRYDPESKMIAPEPLPGNGGGKHGTYAPDLFAKTGLDYLSAHKPGQVNGFRPFFLYYASIIPHANDEEGARSGNGMQVPTDAPYSNEPWPQGKKNKAAMITRLDSDIGELLAKLKELGLDEQTIVLFSSDNGPHKEGGVDPKFFQSSGPFRGIKRDLYEGGIRMPFIARWPGKIKPGSTSALMGAFWDLLPTLAEIAGEPPPKNIDGISLLPTLLSQAQTNQHDFLYWEFHERGFQQAARMGDWKAVRPDAGEKLELYNLKSDPGEQDNVASAHGDVIEKFETYFKTARAPSDLWPMRKASDQKKGKKKAAKKQP